MISLHAVLAAALTALYFTPMTSIFLCQPSLTYLCSRQLLHFDSKSQAICRHPGYAGRDPYCAGGALQTEQRNVKLHIMKRSEGLNTKNVQAHFSV